MKKQKIGYKKIKKLEFKFLFIYNKKKTKEGIVMSGIKLDLKNTGINQKNIMEYKQQVENIHKELHTQKYH